MTGGPDRRAFWWILLKETGLTRQQFQALPAHDQRMYREQMFEDLDRRMEAAGVGNKRIPDSAATAAGFGVNVRKVAQQ